MNWFAIDFTKATFFLPVAAFKRLGISASLGMKKSDLFAAPGQYYSVLRKITKR